MVEKRHEEESPRSEERRNFLEIAGKFGLTTAIVAGAAGTLWSRDAAAQTAKEEKEREEAAKHVMHLAAEYRYEMQRAYPFMALDFKENIQNATAGKVYVKVSAAGQLGVGTQLVEKVQAGTVQAAQHSLSNFSPFAPAVDLINIPYWVGSNQRFVNLITSKVWEEQINARVMEKGFKPLFYYCIDPRTAGKRKGLDDVPFRTPDDLKGIKFRIPASNILKEFYRLCGANPTPVAWGETASAIKQGVADALDPSAGALYVFGFKDVLSWITFNRPVPDSQVYSCNLGWFNALPVDVRDAVMFGSHITFLQNLSAVPASRAHAMAELTKAGVKFYTPTADEFSKWEAACGHQRPEWEPIKKQLAGSTAAFDRLLEAANTPSKFYVHDV